MRSLFRRYMAMLIRSLAEDFYVTEEATYVVFDNHISLL